MPQSMREALEAAFDEQEEQTEEIAAEASNEESGGSIEDAPQSMGAEEASDTGEDQPPVEKAEDAPKEQDRPVPDKPETQPSDAEALKAPVSWKAGVRQEWDKLPKSVQEEVIRREKNIAGILEATAEDRRYSQELRQVTRPYEPIIAAQGVSVPQAINNLMQTASGLMMGTPQQKAEIVKNIIKAHDVSIDILDQMLVGQTSPELQQQSQLAQMLEQRLAPINQFMNTIQQQRNQYQQTTQQEAQNEVDTFGQSHEFFEDVRLDMADLMDLARNRGVTMTLDEAYDRAVMMNPELRQIAISKQRQEGAGMRQQRLAEKRRTASSVRGGPPAAPSQGEPKSIRGALEAAWDNQ
jgi:hypothetical protein